MSQNMVFAFGDKKFADNELKFANEELRHSVEEAKRHYDIGVQIGELSLASGFNGVLPWGLINNRPFLRCLQGYGLCLWRLGDIEPARQVFERMLWLSPGDNQGIRFILTAIDEDTAWEDFDR